MGVVKLSRRIDLNALGSDLEQAARQSAVARAEDILEIRGLDPIFSQSFLRIIEIDLFRKHALAIDFRNLRCALKSARDQFGEIIKIAIGVFTARYSSQLCLGVFRVAYESSLPCIRVNLGSMKAFLEEPFTPGPQDVVA